MSETFEVLLACGYPASFALLNMLGVWLIKPHHGFGWRFLAVFGQVFVAIAYLYVLIPHSVPATPKTIDAQTLVKGYAVLMFTAFWLGMIYGNPKMAGYNPPATDKSSSTITATSEEG